MSNDSAGPWNAQESNRRHRARIAERVAAGSPGSTIQQAAWPVPPPALSITVGQRLDQGDNAPLASVGRPHVVRMAGVSVCGTTGYALVEFLGAPTPMYRERYWLYLLKNTSAIPWDTEWFSSAEQAYATARGCLLDLFTEEVRPKAST